MVFLYKIFISFVTIEEIDMGRSSYFERDLTNKEMGKLMEFFNGYQNDECLEEKYGVIVN